MPSVSEYIHSASLSSIPFSAKSFLVSASFCVSLPLVMNEVFGQGGVGVHFEHLFERGDGDLGHALVRFAGGEHLLDEVTGQPEHVYDGIVEPCHELEDLVRDAGDDGQEHHLDAQPRQKFQHAVFDGTDVERPRHQRDDEDVYGYDYEQERGAAARVQAGTLHDVFRGEGHARFVTGDRLVFGAVIHVQPADVLHDEDQSQICEKDGQLEHAEQHVAPGAVFKRGERAGERVRRKVRQHYKKAYGERDADYHRYRGDHAHQAYLALFGEPLFQPAGLLFLAVDFGGPHEGARAPYEAVEHVNNAPHEGYLCGARGGGRS